MRGPPPPAPPAASSGRRSGRRALGRGEDLVRENTILIAGFLELLPLTVFLLSVLPVDWR